MLSKVFVNIKTVLQNHCTQCPSSPNIVRTFEKILGHFFKTLLPPLTEIAICPSQIKTRDSFATISDGKCGLNDWLAFYLMRRLEHVDRWGSGWGTVFAAFCGSCTTR